MRIGLVQTNLDRGHDLLMEVSDPRSGKYGQHYTAEEIHDLFAPTADSVASVNSWLGESGIDLTRVSQSVNRQWLQFDATVQEVEELLKTKFFAYEHDSTGRQSIGCDDYHVKASIQHHIDYITPGVKTVEIRPRSSTRLHRREALSQSYPIRRPVPANIDWASNNLTYCNKIITPACIQAMYQIPQGSLSVSGNELGIYESAGSYLDSSDMNKFYKTVSPYVPQGTFPTVNGIDGEQNNNNPKLADGETILDFQVSIPIIYPQDSVLWLDNLPFESADHGLGLFTTFLDAIDGSYCTPKQTHNHTYQCGAYKLTNVISSSYDYAEYGIPSVTPAFQRRQCSEYMKLGLQGVSLVFSSGDNGLESVSGCRPNNSAGQPVFNQYSPATCPYVTSVAATVLTGAAEEDREQAVSKTRGGFVNGGGFSNVWARPSWQEAAVEGYFNSSNAPTFPYYSGSKISDGVYNRSGRGYPDLAAIGANIYIIQAGQPSLTAGTSTSAPLFAAILTRINEERIKAGKSTVGFVNPLLYQNPQAFNDITKGSNPGCGSKGFSCAKGWDPVTGLGAPNYPKLLDVFMNA